MMAKLHIIYVYAKETVSKMNEKHKKRLKKVRFSLRIFAKQQKVIIFAPIKLLYFIVQQ